MRKEIKEDNNILNFEDLIKPNNINVNNEPNNLISLIAVQNLLSPKNIKSNSRIKFTQVSELTKLFLYSDIFKIETVRKLANNILDLQISINGLGRKELVELVSQNNNMLESNVKISKKEIFK